MEYTEWKRKSNDINLQYVDTGDEHLIISGIYNNDPHQVGLTPEQANLIAAAPDMYEKLQKVCKWLDMLIADAEKQLKGCNFITLREALARDIKNYKATQSDIKQALAKAEGK